jgi:hypothetical protein
MLTLLKMVTEAIIKLEAMQRSRLVTIPGELKYYSPNCTSLIKN